MINMKIFYNLIMEKMLVMNKYFKYKNYKIWMGAMINYNIKIPKLQKNQLMVNQVIFHIVVN